MTSIAASAFTTISLAHLSLSDNVELPITNQNEQMVYLIRHGESVLNASGSNGNRIISGHSLEIQLSELGGAQASNLGKVLNNKLSTNGKYLIIYSTANRTKETAERIFDELKKNYDIELAQDGDSRLLEVGHGLWEGKPKDKVYHQAIEKWENLSAADKFNTIKLEGGQSFSEVANLLIEAFDEFKVKYPQHTILVASHCNASDALAIRLSGRLEELSQDPKTPMPSLNLKNTEMLHIEVPKNKPTDQAKILKRFDNLS